MLPVPRVDSTQDGFPGSWWCYHSNVLLGWLRAFSTTSWDLLRTGAWGFDQSTMRPFLPQRFLHFWLILECCCFYLTSWFFLFSWCKAWWLMQSYLKSWQCPSSSLPPTSLFQDLFSIIDVLALFFFFPGTFALSCLAVNTARCYRLPPTWFLNP